MSMARMTDLRYLSSRWNWDLRLFVIVLVCDGWCGDG